ncbi:23288_t:CDS:2, partial [Racocetra persica]
TTAPSNNSNSLNPTHATIFFGIGVVVGFVCLGLGQLIFEELEKTRTEKQARLTELERQHDAIPEQ